MQPNDGTAAVAFGLGRTVVDGGKSLSFCPRFPRHTVQCSSVEDVLRNSQTEFMALNLSSTNLAAGKDVIVRNVERLRERAYSLRDAEKDGTLNSVGSTYSRDNDAIYDGLSRPGPRVVTFASILKHDAFPLAPILEYLQKLGSDALGRPVEIEFAVRMGRGGELSDFGFLQMRPLICLREAEDLAIESVEPAAILCRSSHVLGNGHIDNICDVVVVDYESFHRSDSLEVAEIVARLNAELVRTNTSYILIGVGRWGSKDPWLGIPVTWDQVSGARVIVEAGFRDMRVTPSQGSHFFQNLTAFHIAYFTVNPDLGDGLVDWKWFGKQPPLQEFGAVRHIRLDAPLTVAISGTRGVGVILKPSNSVV
jgi:hypothetical protein